MVEAEAAVVVVLGTEVGMGRSLEEWMTFAGRSVRAVDEIRNWSLAYF